MQVDLIEREPSYQTLTMWTFRFLQRVHRSLRIHSNTGFCRNPQWQKTFSTNSFSPYRRREVYYPTDKIKTLEDFEKYASPEDKDHLDFIQSEFIEYCRNGKFKVLEPTDEEWLNCINFESKSSRFAFLKQCERKRLDRNFKQLETAPKEKKNVHDLMDPNACHRFTREMYNFTFRKIAHYRLAQAQMLEEPIVVDFGFTDELYFHEIRDLSLQFIQLFGLAKQSVYERLPTFNLVFCNVKKPWEENQIFRILKSRNYDVDKILDSGITVTEKSYLDLFPKEDLVYLSPDAPHYYHPDDGIPIIGGIIDLTTRKKLSYTKAVAENLEVRKLPIDMVTKVYGNKCLPLDQVAKYINTLRFTGDPYKAYETLPLRKRRLGKKHPDNSLTQNSTAFVK